MAPIGVVGDEFCFPNYTDLIVKKPSHFQVSEHNGTLMFEVDESRKLSFHEYRCIRDLGGFPIVCMRNKNMSWHNRWMAYRGDTCEEKNLLFSVRKSHVFQLRSQFDVFLGRNTDQRIRDFHVIKNSKQKYLVFRGDSVIAEVNHTSTWGGFDVKNDALHLRVYPEVDYAFIVALSVILHEITYSSNDTSSAHHAHHHGAHHHGAHHHHDAHVHHDTYVHHEITCSSNDTSSAQSCPSSWCTSSSCPC